MNIKVKNIPQKDIDEANRILNIKNMSKKGKMTLISATTGLCCHSQCHDKPAEKLVLIKVSGAYKLERYCLEHFDKSYETKKQKKKRRNAKD